MAKIKRIEPSEAQIQSAVVQWWQVYAPTKGLDSRLLISIPNGAVLAGDARSRAMQMAKLKRTGLQVGVPDLFLALPATYSYEGTAGILVFAGAFFELKARTGKVQPAQREYHELLRKIGYNVVTVYGEIEAIQALKSYCERALTR